MKQRFDGATSASLNPIVIVGGGPTGLYTALRLAEDPRYERRQIVVLEAADRLGGRVRTVSYAPLGFDIDLGAMRYKPHQAILRTLVESRFQLDTYEHTFPPFSYFLPCTRLSG